MRGQEVGSLELAWMDMIRGFAILAIIVHHWLLFVPFRGSPALLSSLADLIRDVGGTAVHLFFVLSGCGLSISYFKKEVFSWNQWTKRRLVKIVVPLWIIITLTYIVVVLIHALNCGIFKSHYSWLDLFAYLTFTRNFYRPAFGLNPTLWFMPVILGLYVLFPVLIKVLEKYGAFILLTVSFIITYSSITLCIVISYTVSHQTALFLFYVVEFALGMFVGYIICFHKSNFNRMLGYKAFLLGVGFYCASLVVTKGWKMGDAYNDLLTALGVFLITLNICEWIVHFSPVVSVKVFKQISKKSYLMYLIHGPLILFVIKPLLANSEKLPLHPFISIVFSGLYCCVIFASAKLVYPAMNLVTSHL